MSDANGVITISASIAGNHFGMANIVYNAPMLFGRNSNFKVNSVTGNTFNITLQEDLSYYTDIFKMVPLSMKYGSILVSSDDGSAVTRLSTNGNEWIESNTSGEIDKVTLTIEYGEGAPNISNESPPISLRESSQIQPCKPISTTCKETQWIGRSRQMPAEPGRSLTMAPCSTGEGTVSATPTNMNQYDTTYSWSVSATDPAGSGETVEEFYQFTTKLENYTPIISNASPTDGLLNIPINPTLSVDVSDADGDPLDIVFRTNASGTWEDIDAYSGVGNGTYTATPTQ